MPRRAAFARRVGHQIAEAALPDYRLYLLDPHSGHIEAVEPLHSADDVGAVCLAQERAGAAPMELWCGGRKVARFDGKPETAAALRIRALS